MATSKPLCKRNKNQILILRHPVHRDWLQFNSAGELLSPGPEASWTVDGAIVINKIQITSKTVTLKGKRRWYGFDPRLQRLLPVKMKWQDDVKIEVGLDSPVKDLVEAGAILNRIFVRNEQELMSVVPDYWRPFLAKQYGHDDFAKSVEGSSASENASPQAVKLDPTTMKRPQPVFTPAPALLDEIHSIPEIAEYKVHGVVLLDVIIDTSGRVLHPRIVHPMGLGLDEKAVAAVQNWKFKPATRNGEPVSVEMGIEVAFNLN